jgi:hypothetical protein
MRIPFVCSQAGGISPDVPPQDVSWVARTAWCGDAMVLEASKSRVVCGDVGVKRLIRVDAQILPLMVPLLTRS